MSNFEQVSQKAIELTKKAIGEYSKLETGSSQETLRAHMALRTLNACLRQLQIAKGDIVRGYVNNGQV